MSQQIGCKESRFPTRHKSDVNALYRRLLYSRTQNQDVNTNYEQGHWLHKQMQTKENIVALVGFRASIE